MPFATLEEVIGLPITDPRHVAAEVDPVTKKATYKVPLSEGVLLGNIDEPDVEGKVFKAPNGKVTVYGRLTGSSIEMTNKDALEQLAQGILTGGRSEGDVTGHDARPEDGDFGEDEAESE